MANKFGGTLVAATNTPVGEAAPARVSITIINLSATDSISAEFGAAASTTVGAGSWVISPSSRVVLSSRECPEIVRQLNLISTGTPGYIVRDSTVI